MTEQEQKDIRNYCAFLQQEYGFDFSPSDPVIPALFVIHKEVQSSNTKSEKLSNLVKDAAAKINPTVFHFNQQGEAWKFQLGITIRWIAIGLILSLIIWGAAWHCYIEKDVARAREAVNVSEAIKKLLTQTRRDSKGNYYIDFVDFQKLNAKTVRIYLKQDQNAN